MLLSPAQCAGTTGPAGATLHTALRLQPLANPNAPPPHFLLPSGPQDAERGVLLQDLPPVLQLQLKRFEFDFQRDQVIKVGAARGEVQGGAGQLQARQRVAHAQCSPCTVCHP